jgi:hypothetical protein
VNDNGTQDALKMAEETDPLPALPMQKGSDPDWAKSEPPSGTEPGTDPKQAVPMQKPAPKWAQTVPAPPGEALDETELPATTSKRTWPPAGGPKSTLDSGASAATASEPPVQRAQGGQNQDDAAPAQGAVPEETDIWPPEPPTEHTMPAWPPSSTISEGLLEPSTSPEAEPLSSWPDSFDSVPEVTKPPATVSPAKATVPPVKDVAVAPTVPPQVSVIPTAPTVPPRAEVPTATTVPPAAARPIAPTVPPAATIPPVPTTPPVQTAPPVQTTSPTQQAPTAAVAPVASPTAPAAPAPPAALASTPGTPAQVNQDPATEWPAAVPIPAWAPQIHVSTPPVASSARAAQPASQPPPAPAAAGPHPPSPAPAAPSAAVPASAVPQPVQPKPARTASSSSWEVVEQKEKHDPQRVVPSPEDRSYAEWFAWAKRGGAPASACHAAAQGAFQALSSGKDVATAVQWATAAMAKPPVPVSADRQSYCAWFSLANIDLNLDQHRAHAFATAAVHALDAGADATGAHAAGLHAAGIK